MKLIKLTLARSDEPIWIVCQNIVCFYLSNGCTVIKVVGTYDPVMAVNESADYIAEVLNAD